ncbi:hypothetical protein QBC44DRAFT_358790 [Cladorrhinum sp. PSN332]|nr:hypothetical protein QBC44DRAFT_358790 [Cladorrhinum sp. PSN332]
MRSFIISPVLNLSLFLLMILIPTILATPTPSPDALIPAPQQPTISQPWFITRRLNVPSTREILESITKRHPHAIQVLQHDNLHKRHGTLVRRGAFNDPKWIKIGFAILITVSVILGLAIASIAVFGFEWKKYFGKSSIRAKKAKSLIGPPWAESRPGQYPRI